MFVSVRHTTKIEFGVANCTYGPRDINGFCGCTFVIDPTRDSAKIQDSVLKIMLPRVMG